MRQIWPEWKIVKRIGKGAYGEVYEAVREDFNFVSRAAIKVVSIPTDTLELDSLRTDGLDEESSRSYLEEIVKDFINEIQIMESLKTTSNIVSIEDTPTLWNTDFVYRREQ